MVAQSKNAFEFPAELQVAAFKTASSILRALQECDPKLREAALELFDQLQNDDLDPEQAHATTALIAEILFPNADQDGIPGLDLEEAEKIAPTVDPVAGPLLAEMDRQEATFAERLRTAMTHKGVTQAELAAKIGIGQPAISMMLNRACRPQRKTVEKIANALGVEAEELWPVKKA
jgi:lambda repressor-like predicted transcriptional regulator